MIEKRIYSLNLAAYIMANTNITPEVGVGHGNKGTLCYLVFPECDGVAAAINDYRNNRELHHYLGAYKELREILDEARK